MRSMSSRTCRRTLRALCLLAAMTLLSLPQTSCAALPKTQSADRIVFPVFPSPYNEDGTPVFTEVTDSTGEVTGVTVPLWYWKELGLYAASIKAVRRSVNKEF